MRKHMIMLILTSAIICNAVTSATANEQTAAVREAAADLKIQGPSLSNDFEDGIKIGDVKDMLKERATISVSASGSVTSTPDKASLCVQVIAEEDTAKASMEQCEKKSNKIIDALKDMDIQESNITMTETNVYPLYDYTSQTQRIRSYAAQITMSISDQDINLISDIIAVSLDNGADNISQLEYLCSDYDEKYKDALQLAMQNAREKADAIAQMEGMKIEGISSMIEGYEDTSLRRMTITSLKLNSAEGITMDAEGTLNIPDGTQEITAEVNAVFFAG